MFTKDTTVEDERRQKLLDELAEIRAELKALRKERKDAEDTLGLVDKITMLKTQIADLEVNKSKLTEQHEREKREVEHMVGLQKKQQTFEVDSAKREATLAVREENLKAQREQFDKHMEFIQDRFTSEVDYLKDMIGQVLGRLPNIEISGDLPTPSRRKPVA